MRLACVPPLVVAQHQLFLAPTPSSKLAAQSAPTQYGPYAQYPQMPGPAPKYSYASQYAVPYVEAHVEAAADRRAPIAPLLLLCAAAGAGLAMLASTGPVCRKAAARATSAVPPFSPIAPPVKRSSAMNESEPSLWPGV